MTHSSPILVLQKEIHIKILIPNLMYSNIIEMPQWQNLTLNNHKYIHKSKFMKTKA